METKSQSTSVNKTMSLTSEELNYLIWRYLQETGHEVTALALQEESRILEFDEKFREHIPLGCLVNFVQRGILYTESDLLVRYDGEVTPIDPSHYSENFNLVQALEVDKNKYPDLVAKGRFALENDQSWEEQHTDEPFEENLNGEGSPDFIKTLQAVHLFPSSTISQWNPKLFDVFAWGGRDSTAKVVKFECNSGKLAVLDTITLQHPFALSIASENSKTTNEVTCLSWSPSGESLITGVENGELRMWSSQGMLQNVFNFHRSPVVSIEWNADSTHVLTSDVDNITIVWNALTGTALQHFDLKDTTGNESLGIDVEWIETDKFVIPGLQGSILVFSIGESKPIGKLVGHTKTLTVLCYNSDNKLLLSASDDKTLRTWRGGNVNSSNCFYGHTQSITCADWLDDDRLISTSMDGSVRVWSVKQNALVGLSVVDGVPIFCGTLSSDKQKFATGTLDGEVSVYNVKKLLEVLDADEKPIGPVRIPTIGDYQSTKEGSYVSDLSWDKDGTNIAVSYSLEESSILSLT